MIRTISLLAVSATTLFIVSCGCPQEIPAPTLRKMPNFKELPSATDIEGTDIPVVPTK